MPTAICPKCGMNNCAAELNYCMYGCGHAFNDVMGIYKQKTEEPKQEQPKTDLKGNLLLFGTKFIGAN